MATPTPRVRVPAKAKKGEVIEIKTLISHDMEMGTRKDADGKTIEGGIMYDVRVTADINSNSLVVTGPEENMSLIQALIDSLDQLPEVETKIKVFPVTNNDSGVLLQLLTDLFSTQQQGGGGGQQGGLSNLPLQSGIGGDSRTFPVSG